MKITLITVGKIKEKYLTLAVDEYSKRLSKYCKLSIIEVIDEKTPNNANQAIDLQIKFKEAQRILKHIPENAYIISLAIGGEMLSSESLADKMAALALSGISHIVFVIGGSIGLSDKVMKRSDYQLSFSKMTFPHQLMRVILLEQIYRSYRIISKEPYHK